MAQFVATRMCRQKCSKALIKMSANTSDFVAILFSKQLREFRKPKFRNIERVRNSKYDLPFRKAYKSLFIQEILGIVALSSRKPPTYTIKHEQDDYIRGEFYQKELINVI